jgi:hypothetical protein
MPGRMINRDDDCWVLTDRRGARDIPPGRRNRDLQALWFALARLPLLRAGGASRRVVSGPVTPVSAATQ